MSITEYWKGGAIYANETDADIAKSVVTPRLNGRRVGIYADERTFKKAPRRLTPFTVVGSYASYKTEWPGAMMVLSKGSLTQMLDWSSIAGGPGT